MACCELDAAQGPDRERDRDDRDVDGQRDRELEDRPVRSVATKDEQATDERVEHDHDPDPDDDVDGGRIGARQHPAEDERDQAGEDDLLEELERDHVLHDVPSLAVDGVTLDHRLMDVRIERERVIGRRQTMEDHPARREDERDHHGDDDDEDPRPGRDRVGPRASAVDTEDLRLDQVGRVELRDVDPPLLRQLDEDPDERGDRRCRSMRPGVAGPSACGRPRRSRRSTRTCSGRRAAAPGSGSARRGRRRPAGSSRGSGRHRSHPGSTQLRIIERYASDR